MAPVEPLVTRSLALLAPVGPLVARSLVLLAPVEPSVTRSLVLLAPVEPLVTRSLVLHSGAVGDWANSTYFTIYDIATVVGGSTTLAGGFGVWSPTSSLVGVTEALALLLLGSGLLGLAAIAQRKK